MVLEVVLCVSGVLLLIPVAILVLETMAATLLPCGKHPQGLEEATPRTAVLIPAHDEGAQIAATVQSLATDLGPRDRLIVIADNCADDTAALAARAGAMVIERHDPERRGKGFAIAFGLAHLDADPPDAIVLIDADCRVSAGGVRTLARLAVETNRPVQAEYLMSSSHRSGPTAVVSALAILIRNRVRPLGLHRLGLPCHLTGSGMAFPWGVLRDAPETGANLVEDLVMGIETALRGHPASWCPEVKVTSELPHGRAAATSQRRRWEHGQLHTLARYVPRLVAAGLARRRPGLLALGLDLMVPPLALLATLQGIQLVLSVVAAATGLTTFTPAILGAFGVAGVATAVGIAWVRFGRQTIPLRYALFIPFYILWKIPIYLSLFLRGKQKTWERTARPEEGDPARGADSAEPAKGARGSSATPL